MRKLLTLLTLFTTSYLISQNSVTGNFTDLNDIEDVALYRIVRGNLSYIEYTNVENQQFVFSLAGLPAGNYRALYQNIKTGYVDFIYNNENIKFTVKSTKGQPSVSFLNSRENQLLHAYNSNIGLLQYKLDSIQLKNFSKQLNNVAKYQEIKSKIDGAQQYYEELAKNDYCLGIIKASKRHNAPLPYALPNEYLDNIINHFFDYIDFSDLSLRNSMFINSRLSDYVFYLHQIDDVVQQNELYIHAIKQILSATEDNFFKEEVLTYFIEEFVNRENSIVSHAIINFYKDLPDTFQNKEFLVEMDHKASTLIGVIAPDFKISETETLKSLNETNKYLIVFWSSNCHHCSEELPKIKEILKDKKDITVITVGLENIESKANWQKKVDEQFGDWKNVLRLDKWDSKEAISYDINATPTYFVLNKSKRIIAKPKDLKNLIRVMNY